VGFVKLWARGLRTVRQRYSIPERQRDHPLRDDWWESLTPDVADITVPALVCGSFSDNNLHSRGSFRGYAGIASADRYLYTHRSGKWATFYAEDARRAQRQFFDRYLRNANSNPPRIRLEVRESRDRITAIRAAEAWPPPEIEWTELYLTAEGLRLTPANEPGRIRFPVRSRGASWGWSLPEDVELIGPMHVTLWIEAHDTDDLDLFVGVEKWADGRYLPFEGSYGFGRDRITTGWQRMSLRSVDESQPTFDQPRPVQPGDCIPVTVELGPSATRMRRGEDLRLVLAGRWLWPRNPLTGQFPAAYAALRRGSCSVHWGPDRPSRLIAPVLRPPGTSRLS
jgi:putative CocE/NonD family hydrolase